MRDLTHLLAQPEGQFFDRKSLWEGPPGQRRTRDRRKVRDQIAEYVAAFANADGGVLVLGAEDDGTVSGHNYPDEAVEQMLLVPAQRTSPPLPKGERVSWQGHELLVFEVPAAEQAVMVVGNGFPRRVGDRVFQESELNINAIKARGRVESIERDLSLGFTLADLSEERLVAARQGAGLGHLAPGDYLVERRLADYRDGALLLRKGALLLFAKRARAIEHPNAGVRIFRVNGTVRETGPRHNVQELPRIEGALPEVIERTYAVIGGLIHKSAKLYNLFFQEMPEYPTFAWQEAIVNAIAHRDYRVLGRTVEVWLYDDRLEVISPGGLLPEVDLERLRSRESVHWARNPLITRVLAELGVMREQGEGIPRMFEEMERSWLQLPELEPDRHLFKVILRNEPIVKTPDQAWVDRLERLPINARQKRILGAFPHGTFTNHDYQQINQVDRDTAYRELKELVDRHLLIAPRGRGRGARYQVSREPVAVPMTPRERLDLKMRESGAIRNADYQEAFEVDRFEASDALAKLVETGALVREGRLRGTRYRPGSRWNAWVRSPQNHA